MYTLTVLCISVCPLSNYDIYLIPYLYQSVLYLIAYVYLSIPVCPLSNYDIYLISYVYQSVLYLIAYVYLSVPYLIMTSISFPINTSLFSISLPKYICVYPI